MDGFYQVVNGSVADFVVDQRWGKFVLFKNKLKFLKNRLRDWRLESKAKSDALKTNLEARLKDIDSIIDDGNVFDSLLIDRKLCYSVWRSYNKLMP